MTRGDTKAALKMHLLSKEIEEANTSNLIDSSYSDDLELRRKALLEAYYQEKYGPNVLPFVAPLS
jgi:hypothetical protein